MPLYSFPKTERILKKWEFQNVFAGNEKYAGKYFDLYILRNQYSRKIGLIVSRRAGNAVKRNRLKRVLRETYRLNKNLLPNNIHLVASIRQKTEVNSLKYKDIEAEFLKLLKEAGILK